METFKRKWQRERADHGLFKKLADAHELTPRQRRVLCALADHHRLVRIAEAFVRPSLFDLDPPPGIKRGELRTVRVALFANDPAVATRSTGDTAVATRSTEEVSDGESGVAAEAPSTTTRASVEPARRESTLPARAGESSWHSPEPMVEHENEGPMRGRLPRWLPAIRARRAWRIGRRKAAAHEDDAVPTLPPGIVCEAIDDPSRPDAARTCRE